MPSLYLTQQGTRIKKEQEQFILSSADQELLEVSIPQVERILIYGNIQLTTAVIDTCLSANIPIVFLTQSGSYKGHIYNAKNLDLSIQIKQFKYRDNEDFQLDMAHQMVKGKIKNSKQFLLRLNRKRNLASVEKNIMMLSEHLEKIERADSVESLLGHEGNSAANYFAAFGDLIVNDKFIFTERNRQPPKDPVNSLLSFGYTLLFNHVMGLILAEGLNPYLGNLHRSQSQNPELALDLMEEFRSPIVDTLVMRLINQKLLNPNGFTPPNEEGGVYLNDLSRRLFIREFEERINEKVTHPDVQYKVSYRRAIHLQVQRYKRCLLESVTYQSFLRAD
jgi:CRISPR-associated protein Cas1